MDYLRVVVEKQERGSETMLPLYSSSSVRLCQSIAFSSNVATRQTLEVKDQVDPEGLDRAND